MNNHLNLFRSYAKIDRENQLEDDLTRALALTLLECPLFCHEVLQYIIQKDTAQDVYNNIFLDYNGKKSLNIGIQGNVNNFENSFDKLFAVSLSGHPMDEEDFYNQENNRKYGAITDLYIQVDTTLIIVEVKPNNYNCTSQLYNQALNVLKETPTKNNVVAVDLNWNKLMELTLCTSNFLKSLDTSSRFLSDFITVVKKHNPAWLPEYPLASLNIQGDRYKIEQRLISAIESSESNLSKLENRLGFAIELGWINEVLIDVKPETESLLFSFYPGNTKGQGHSLYPKKGSPQFKESITIDHKTYEYKKHLHLKFTSFQKYFTSIDIQESDLVYNIMERPHAINFCGRKKRGEDNWKEVEDFFNGAINENVNWKDKCGWENIVGSGKKQFDLCFGYAMSFEVPFSDLKVLDSDKNNILPLVDFINKIEEEVKNCLV